MRSNYLSLDKQERRMPNTLFNDRRLNEDLITLCERVSKIAPRLPDGRRLLFMVGCIHRPILDQQKRRVA